MSEVVRELIRSAWRRVSPESRLFVRQTRHMLLWWLAGFGERGVSFASAQRESAIWAEAVVEPPSVSVVVARLARSAAERLIALEPMEVRREVLAYLEAPEGRSSLLAMNSENEMMPADMVGIYRADLLPHVLAGIQERAPSSGLSPRAHTLFVAIRHLWGRAVVTAGRDRHNEYLRAAIANLTDDTLLALNERRPTPGA